MPIPIAAEAPLVVTAHLDDAGFSALDALRRRHFPAALNRVPAHISLFHHLPGAELRSVLATIRAACAPLRPFALDPLPPRCLGRSVALAYEAPALATLREGLAGAWEPWLTAQDRQPFRAHVTIQNKVAPRDARALLDALATFTPPEARVEGIDLWRYRGGPWEAVASVPFG